MGDDPLVQRARRRRLEGEHVANLIENEIPASEHVRGAAIGEHLLHL